MSVLSQVNWLGNQRVELQHLRAIDSYVQQDFEALSLVLAGTGGAVVSGITVAADSATVTVTIADNAVVLMPSGSDGVMFANLTGAPITKTITRNSGAAQDVYLNLARSESGTSVPYTFIDPNTKKAFTQMKSDSRVLVVSANSASTGIKIASIDASNNVTLENRLFGAGIDTLKEYAAQTDSAISTLQQGIGFFCSFLSTSVPILPTTSGVPLVLDPTSPLYTVSNNITHNTTTGSFAITSPGFYRLSLQGVMNVGASGGTFSGLEFFISINGASATRLGSAYRYDYGNIAPGDKIQCSIERIFEVPTDTTPTILITVFKNTGSGNVEIGSLSTSPLSLTLQKVPEL